MMNRILFFLSLTLLFHFHFSTTLAQSPAASPAVPPVPFVAAPPVSTSSPNIIKILEKAGQFTLFVRLLKSTSVGVQINGQLKNSGLTVFAPSDNAFSGLKAGTLNSLTSQQQIELLQFHVLPNYYSTAQFQTVTNPLRTQAGGNGPGQFPLNVTTTGNQVNVSTGVMDTPITSTIYTDNKLAVYQVDSVLLPWSIFGAPVPTPSPAPAPSKAPKRAHHATLKPAPLTPAPMAPTKKKTPAAAANSPSSSDDADANADADASGADSLTMHGMVVTIGVAVVASFLL